MSPRRDRGRRPQDAPISRYESLREAAEAAVFEIAREISPMQAAELSRAHNDFLAAIESYEAHDKAMASSHAEETKRRERHNAALSQEIAQAVGRHEQKVSGADAERKKMERIRLFHAFLAAEECRKAGLPFDPARPKPEAIFGEILRPEVIAGQLGVAYSPPKPPAGPVLTVARRAAAALMSATFGTAFLAAFAVANGFIFPSALLANWPLLIAVAPVGYAFGEKVREMVQDRFRAAGLARYLEDGGREHRRNVVAGTAVLFAYWAIDVGLIYTAVVDFASFRPALAALAYKGHDAVAAFSARSWLAAAAVGTAYLVGSALTSYTAARADAAGIRVAAGQATTLHALVTAEEFEPALGQVNLVALADAELERLDREIEKLLEDHQAHIAGLGKQMLAVPVTYSSDELALLEELHDHIVIAQAARDVARNRLVAKFGPVDARLRSVGVHARAAAFRNRPERAQ
jgi:hypothetical protein